MLRPTIGAIVVALIVGGAAAALGAASVLRRPNVYESATVLVLDQPKSVAQAGSEGIVIKLSRLRAKYATLLKTTRLIEPIAQKVGLPPGRVAGSLSSSLPGTSQVMVIATRTSSPSVSRGIAAAAADELVAYLGQEMEANKIAVEDRFTLTIVTPAQPGQKVEPTTAQATKNAAQAGALGLAGAYALYQGIAARRRS